MERHRDPQNRAIGPDAERGADSPETEAPEFAIPAALGKQLSRTGREFLADFLGTEVQRHPENVTALTALSQSLAQLDRRLQGLSVDQQLADLEPHNPIVQYNLACSQALNGDCAGAMVSLQQAVTLGFADASFIASDPDLESLHPLKTFRRLVEALSQGQPTRPE
jgi:hypothetical protein